MKAISYFLMLFSLCCVVTLWEQRSPTCEESDRERLNQSSITLNLTPTQQTPDSTMLLFLYLMGLTLAGKAPTADPDMMLTHDFRPPSSYSLNVSAYKYVATHMTWADAEINCVSQGANLVSIHSLEENTFVKDLIKNSDPEQEYTWIGLHDVIKEGAWMWTDGSAVNFKVWDAGQPDNNNNEDCTMILSNSKWNDAACQLQYPSVCKARQY
ncbi:lithostathine-like [Nelusetta ayraudi]|uniref:lithostathine-like n=1 Tax=Nelusetta ayraudi TaxID=303726 RepID=UPI003F715075